MKRLTCAAVLMLSLLVAVTASSGSTVSSGSGSSPSSGRLTGTVTDIGGTGLTIQTPGRQIGLIAAMTTAADALAADDYPYVWGGGHGVAGVASIGMKGGPGANGRRRGFDCSGSVAAVLEAAGLWPAGYGVPNDAGVIQQLLTDGVIERGPGTTPEAVTLYDRPGVHIFMNIDGRFFGTSDGAGGGGNTNGGPGWLADGAPDASSRRFKRYHLLPAVLRDKTAYGHIFGFQFVDGELALAALVGDQVSVTYQQLANGSMLATGITILSGPRPPATGLTGPTGPTGPTEPPAPTGGVVPTGTTGPVVSVASSSCCYSGGAGFIPASHEVSATHR
jgi:hypothetical protein